MASNIYREPVIQPIDEATIKQMSDNLGLGITDKELHEYAGVINGSMKNIHLICQIPEQKPEVAYPRVPGIQPDPQDNKYNAWHVKTNIQGETTGLLAGKRVAIKDNIAVAGVQLRSGSRLLEGHVPDYDATVVTRVLKQGGIISGKATCENFIGAGNSFTSVTGPVLNPRDPTRAAGGSSSGCAALLAAGEVDMALASDTGGSIRIPASRCGVIGMKPTFGLVPTTGALGICENFEHVGPMARTVTDCATLLQVIAGQDEFDHKQHIGPKTDDYLKQLEDGVSGIKIGLLKEGFQPCDADVQQVVKQAVDRLIPGGCIISDVSAPDHKLAEVLFGTIFTVGVGEIKMNNGGLTVGTGGWHDTQMGDRLRMAVETQARALSKSIKVMWLKSEFFKKNDRLHLYAKAENAIPRIRKMYNDILSDCDVIIMPTNTNVATKLPEGELSVIEYMREALGTVSNTCAFNMTGHPAISMNARESRSPALPVGLMIVGRHFEDAMVLRVARALEKLLTKQ